MICAPLIAAIALLGQAQAHGLKPAEALKKLDFMRGNWVGKQNFNVPGGEKMVGDASNSIHAIIGERYIEESLSTTLAGRQPTDTRHITTYDPKTNTFKSWWFNDTTVAPSEFEGNVTGNKLEMTSKPTATGNVMRVTYESPEADKLIYKLEMKQGEGWMELFTTTYHRRKW